MNPYDDTPADTWIYSRSVPAPVCGPGVSSSSCGCVLPASCSACDGTDAERREMWRMPRAERRELELANLRLDPHWRELHDTTETAGAA